MPKRKFTEAEIIGAIHQLDAGRTCIEVAREVGVLKHTLYFSDPEQRRPCGECLLMQFVPSASGWC
jgi:hypothetical protein